MRNIRSVAMAFPLAVLVFASIGVLAPLTVAAAPCGTSTVAGVTTVTFCFTGAAQTWTVPVGVHSAKFAVLGAAGGAGASGAAAALGGRSVATVTVVPGATVTIMVGGQGVKPTFAAGCAINTGGAGGFNGGAIGGNGAVGQCGGSGGGGASDVRLGGNALINRAVVAGGGGGGSQDFAGGAGGGLVGVNGSGAAGAGGGGGGTQGAGGAFGNGDSDGTAGTLGVGGAGGTNCGPARGGGGGGGGFFGGGGGGVVECGAGGAGGGGSARNAFGAVLAAGVRAGAGLVSVSYTVPLPATSATEPPIPWLPIAGLAIGLGLIGLGMRRRRATA